MAQSAFEQIMSSIKNSFSPQPGTNNIKAWGKTLGGMLPQRVRSPVPAGAPAAQNVSGPPPQARPFGLQNIPTIRAKYNAGKIGIKPEPTMIPIRAEMEDFGFYTSIPKNKNSASKIKVRPSEEKTRHAQLKTGQVPQYDRNISNRIYATPTPPPKVQETINPNYAQFLENSIFPITRQYNIPDAVAAAQWAMEGGRVTSNPQNNPWGLMAGGKLLQYPSIEASTRDYGLTVQNILKNKGYDVNETDAFNILMALQEGDSPRYEAHNPNPYTYVTNLIGTPEWRAYYR